MSRIWFPALLFLGLLAGCGYHPAGHGTDFPGGMKTVWVQTFSNGTYEPFLEALLTDRVVAEFAQGGLVKLEENPERADGEIRGEVADYQTKAIAFDRHDQPTDYRSIMKVRATLRRRQDGKVFWKGEVSWSEEYPAAFDKETQEVNESAAIKVLSENLAEELYLKMVENF